MIFVSKEANNSGFRILFVHKPVFEEENFYSCFWNNFLSETVLASKIGFIALNLVDHIL